MRAPKHLVTNSEKTSRPMRLTPDGTNPRLPTIRLSERSRRPIPATTQVAPAIVIGKTVRPRQVWDVRCESRYGWSFHQRASTLTALFTGSILYLEAAVRGVSPTGGAWATVCRQMPRRWKEAVSDCNCELCQTTRRIRGLCTHGEIGELRSLAMDLWDRCRNAESELEVYRAIESGEWPSARAQAEAILRRVEEREKAGARPAGRRRHGRNRACNP